MPGRVTGRFRCRLLLRRALLVGVRRVLLGWVLVIGRFRWRLLLLRRVLLVGVRRVLLGWVLVIGRFRCRLLLRRVLLGAVLAGLSCRRCLLSSVLIVVQMVLEGLLLVIGQCQRPLVGWAPMPVLGVLPISRLPRRRLMLLLSIRLPRRRLDRECWFRQVIALPRRRFGPGAGSGRDSRWRRGRAAGCWWARRGLGRMRRPIGRRPARRGSAGGRPGGCFLRTPTRIHWLPADSWRLFR
jgi:hypothetical protein